MIKNRKVKQMFNQNNIQRENITFIHKLKQIIQDLRDKLKNAQQKIESFQRSKHFTTIQEMKIQIQHLNEENNRLIQMRPKKIEAKEIPFKQSNQIVLENNIAPKIDIKLSDILKQNQELKAQIVRLKLNQKKILKMNEKNVTMTSKDLQASRIYQKELQTLMQQKIYAQAESKYAKKKIKLLEERISQLQQKENQ